MQTSGEFDDLVAAALALEEPAQREAYIEQLAASDPELAQQLRHQLTAESAVLLYQHAAQLTISETAGPPARLPSLGQLGKFRLDRLVGRGGMGNVFLAFDEQLARPVALKFPRLDALGNPQLLDRFLSEARLAAQLNHPNLVKIFEVGVLRETCFIASEWCQGGDLANWLSEHPGAQPTVWSASLVRDIARAVAYCHQQNVVHLDIKPANIILAADSTHVSGADFAKRPGELLHRPLLTDFGVARVIEEGLTQTHTSCLMGTPLYMAPEQAAGQRALVGPQSDIFSLGVVLHELLYGRRPFQGDSPVEVIDQLRRSDSLIIPKCDLVPPELRTICERCLQQSPQDRFGSADALADDLDRYLRGEPIQARPVSRWTRIWHQLQRPERLVQAGIVGLVVQGTIILNFITLSIAMAFGGADEIEDRYTIFWQLGLIVLSMHVPNAICAYATTVRKAWGYLPGLLLSLLALAMLLKDLVTRSSLLNAYEGEPLALLFMYTLLVAAVGLQSAAYLAALPAFLCRRR